MTTVDSDSSETSTLQRRFKFREAVLSDIGLRRNENQDAYGIAHTAATSLFVVADGMGGARGGATASAMAVHVIINHAIKPNGLITRPSLKEAIEKANASIYRRSKDDEDLAGMGTTVVALAFVNECVIVAHVGDSRIYRLRAGEIAQLTHDHTLVQELVDSGAIPKEEAENHPIAHMLTRSLGPTPHVEVEITALPDPVEEGDRFLLCSDGLYNLVTEEEIGQHLRDYTPDEAVQKLIKLALERGGTDNVTVEILETVSAENSSIEATYPPNGEVRFVCSEGVSAPELRSFIESAEEESLNGDTQRDLPSVSGVDDAAGLEDVVDEALNLKQNTDQVGTAPAIDRQAGKSFRLQASLLFVLGLTALIVGFFISQYSQLQTASNSTSVSEVLSTEVGQQAGQDTPVDEPELASDTIESLPGDRAATLTPETIPTMRGETQELANEFLQAIALPEAPYIQIRDPKIADIEANQPIVWENEQRKIQEILSAPRIAAANASPTSEPTKEPALLSTEEKLFLLQEKATLRDRIADLDSKLRVLGFFSKEQAEEFAAKTNEQVRQKGADIIAIRQKIDRLRNEIAMWRSQLDLARGRSAIRLAEEMSVDYGELTPVFEAFSRSSERYAKAVEAWQAEPNNVAYASEMGDSGRELQQARVALEQKLSVFVEERLKQINADLSTLQLREELITTERDQLSRFEGYLRGYTELTPARRKELRDAYYKERGELAQQLLTLVTQLPDAEEIKFRLESIAPLA